MRWTTFALCALLAGCNKTASEPDRPTEGGGVNKQKPAPLEPVTLPERYSRPAAERVVAIGDLHGDMAAVQGAFRLAGAVDEQDKWIGGKLVVVQTGDVIDRGDDDKRILDWLERVQGEAKAAGGELILLYGNHELMNVQGDFRYVTPGGFSAFGGGGPMVQVGDAPAEQAGRRLAFLPGGSYAKKLAQNHLLFVRVGRSVFVHGGILPKHARMGLPAMDAAVATWLQGGNKSGEAQIAAEDSPVWARAFSDKPKPSDCVELDKTLQLLDADQLVMGHTVHKHIECACDCKAWTIDVGMSRFYKGPIEILEITGDGRPHAVKQLKTP